MSRPRGSMENNCLLTPCWSLLSPCIHQNQARSKVSNNKIVLIFRTILYHSWSNKSPKISKKSINKPWKNLLNKKISPNSHILQPYPLKRPINFKEGLGSPINKKLKKTLNKGEATSKGKVTSKDKNKVTKKKKVTKKDKKKNKEKEDDPPRIFRAEDSQNLTA